MSKLIRRRLFWNQAGSSGLIVGGVLTIANLWAYFMRNEVSSVTGTVNNILIFGAFMIVPYFLGRQFARKNALWGLTFQRGLAYMLVTYLLAGFIYGVSTYVIYNFDMQYYVAECQKVINAMGLQGAESSEAIEDLLSNPLQMAFSFMFSLPFLAFLPALIISVLIKREPAIRNYK